MANGYPAIPSDQFEAGLLPFPNIDVAKRDSSYVDSGVILDHLSQQPPWTLSLLYGDGAALSIPLELMSFQSLTGPTATAFRRHKASGRIIPCQLLQDDPRFRDPSLANVPWQDVVQRVVPPRFDPTLTPSIIAILNQEQVIYLALGVLNVIRLQLLNPVLFGWSPGATAEGAASRVLARSAVRRALITPDSTALAARFASEVTGLPASRFQQFLEAVRRLSQVSGVSPQVKADAITEIAKRLGLEVGGQSVQQGGRILIVAKDARTALQVAADGSITFGRVRITGATLDIVDPVPIRVFKP
jgi:hypothetical protein